MKTIASICRSFGGWYEQGAWRFPSVYQMQECVKALRSAGHEVDDLWK